MVQESSNVDSPVTSPTGPAAVRGATILRMRRRIATAGLVLTLLSGLFFYLQPVRGRRSQANSPSPRATAPEPPKTHQGSDEPGNEDSKGIAASPRPAAILPEQLTGRWLRRGSIRREVQMRGDGTATLNIQLDYFTGLIYGRETDLLMTWELDGDILTQTMIGGTPKANYDRIIRDFGNSISYRVVKADPDELILESLDDDHDRDRWTAVK